MGSVTRFNDESVLISRGVRARVGSLHGKRLSELDDKASKFISAVGVGGGWGAVRSCSGLMMALH